MLFETRHLFGRARFCWKIACRRTTLPLWLLPREIAVSTEAKKPNSREERARIRRQIWGRKVGFEMYGVGLPMSLLGFSTKA